MRGLNGCLCNLRRGDGRIGDLCRRDREICNVCGGDGRFGDLCGGDGCQRNLGCRDGRVGNLRLCDGRLLDAGRRDGGFGDLRGGNRRVCDLRVGDLRVADVRSLNGGVGNQSRCDGCGLNMGCLNGCHADLQRANRARLKLAAAYRIESQLCTGDAAAGQLPSRDHIALDGVGDGTQCHGSVLAGKAVVGVLRHAHGHLHADAAGDYPDAVAEKDILQKAILSVFLGFGAVDEVHLQRDCWQVTALVELRLCRRAHLRVALRLRFLVIALCDLFGLGNREMHPFGMRIVPDVRAVDVQLRQIQKVAVLVLAGGHDAGGDVGQIHIIADPQQILALPDLYIPVAADTPDQKHIEPVPGQLSLVLFHQSALAQKGFHGIDVFPFHLIRSGIQIRIEGEIVLRLAFCRDLLHDRSPHRRG